MILVRRPTERPIPPLARLSAGPVPNVPLVAPSPPGLTILNLCDRHQRVDQRTDGRGVFHPAQGPARQIDDVVGAFLSFSLPTK